MNSLADFRFQIYTKLSYLTNNSHESFFCANILTVIASVYANNKSNHINLLFCFALNITSSLNLSTADNLNDKLQFIGGIINEQECKHRRLWRLAVATHPRTRANEVIADRCYAMGGCVATARRHSLLG